MSQLLFVQEKLQTVGAAIGRLEMEIASRPESSGLVANMRSLRRLHENLRDDFARAANQLGCDVLHYRLLEERPTAKALSSSVGTFQEAISVAYDALRFGPKIRRTISSLIASESALQVAYSYPGSFGVVFTIPNERLLVPDMPSQLDDAVHTVISLGKSHASKTTIAEVEKRLGKATISAVYSWAKANSQSRLGTAIEWRRRDEVREEVLIQEPEFKALSETLENIEGHSETELTYSGTLVGADISSQRFHFVVSANDEDIRGSFVDAISDSQVAEIPRRYSAIIRKKTDTTYATEEEKTSYFLEKLEPI